MTATTQVSEMLASQSSVLALSQEVKTLTALLTQQAAVVSSLSRRLEVANTGIAVLVRAVYQKAGTTFELESVLKECANVSLPQ
jgi:hypothetical protein